MEGVYPIFIDAQPVGKLNVKCAGGMTEFEARCRMTEGIVRISVYGQGREGRLGVMVPEGGELVLRKKLSRTAMRNFPEEIEMVERSGMELCPPEPETPPEAEQVSPAQPEELPPKAQEPEEQAPGTPKLNIDDDTCWYSSPDGVLVCFDGEHSLVAFPVGDVRVPAGHRGDRRSIEGREYEVYMTKNGRIVDSHTAVDKDRR